jgi:hypothetical protein
MSIVMMKLRVKSPYSRGAAHSNANHIKYIGERPGVALNENMKHGLFGEIDGVKSEENGNLDEMCGYVKSMTQKGTVMYRAILSLTEADAVRLGYDDPQKWHDLLKRKFPEICDKIGISISSLEYSAAVHPDVGHVHCHLLFWDKAQRVKKNAFVPPRVANDIRVLLTKDVFGDEMSELYKIKNEARSASLNNLRGFFADFTKTFEDMSAKDFTEATERLRRNGEFAAGRLIYNRFKNADMRGFAAELLKLCEKVPRTGRLDMKFMPLDTKTEIHDFVRQILAANADCNREFLKCLNAAEELSKYYSMKSELHGKARQNAENDMMNRLGNAVLRAVKKINQIEHEKGYELNHQAYQREMIESLVTEIFGILSRSSEAEDNKLSYARRTGELSKQAQKERALALENSSGYDWER